MTVFARGWYYLAILPGANRHAVRDVGAEDRSLPPDWACPLCSDLYRVHHCWKASVRLTIDAKQFARDGASIEGELAPDRLKRVQESASLLGSAWYRITGQRSALGKPALAVAVRCALMLVCQRCLEPVSHGVEHSVVLELSDDQREIDEAQDDIDRVLASPALDVAELVEDEILLALPMVACHAACELPAGLEQLEHPPQSMPSERSEQSAAGNGSGPWAALARLKHR